MGEMVGETFVTITPVVNPAEFKAAADTQIQKAVQQIKVEVPVSPVQTQLTGGGLQTVQNEFLKAREQAFAAAKEAEAAAGLAGDKLLVGAASTEEAAAALDAYTAAATAAAKADVNLKIATGEVASTYTASIALLQQQKLATIEDTAATDQNTRSHLENSSISGRRGTSPRRLAEEIGRGQAPISEALSLPKLAAGTLAIGALFSASQRLSDALKVTGDEAFTTEGKLRNFGAEVLKGDLLGGFIALNAHAKTASEQLKELKADANTTQGELAAFADQTQAAADKVQEIDDKTQQSGKALSGFAGAIHKAAEELKQAAADARNFAAEIILADQATQSFQATVAHAGSEAAQFGEATRGPGAVAQGTPLIPRGDPGSTVDSTATTANANAIREANARTLQDQLGAAADEENQIKAQIKAAQAQGGEGVEALKVALANKQKEERGIRKQISDQADADRKQRAQDAKTAHDKAVQDAKDRAAAAAQALRDALQFRENTLQGALDAAQTGTVAQQREALRKLIAFNLEESRNRALDKAERQKALLEAKGYQRDLAQLNREQLAAALGVKEQNLRNAIEAAKLTSTTADDDRANAAFLKFLKDQVDRAKKLKDGGEALANAKANLIAFQLSLKNAAQGGGSSFSLGDLFHEAASEFATFGSNVAPNAQGVLSPQDARAAFAQVVDPKLGVAKSQLSEQEKTNRILVQMLNHTAETVAHARVKVTDRGISVGDAHGGFGASWASVQAAKFGLNG